MKWTQLVTLFVAVSAVACSHKKPAPDQPAAAATGTLAVVAPNTQDARTEAFLSQKSDVQIDNDHYSFVGKLELPEVELTKNKPNKTKYPDARNGNVCILVSVHTSNTKEVWKQKWVSEIYIDKKKVDSLFSAYPLEMLGAGGAKSVVPGEFMIQGCTKGKFMKVNEVDYSLSTEKKKKEVTKFQWAKPWPVPDPQT